MKHWRYFIIALSLLTLCSCSSFESDDLIIDEVGEDCALYDIYVDEYGNEGVIACIYEDRFMEKFIIAISADEGYGAWGPMGEAVYKPDGISFDTVSNYYILYYPSFGLMMQQSMKSMGINRFPAQQWCDRKNQGDPYTNAASWRLPTIYEMQILLEDLDLDKLNNALMAINGTPIEKSNYYWTCTEDIENYVSMNDSIDDFDKENRAIPVTFRFSSYINKDYWLKKNKYHVRAIKYVYYKN